MLGRLHFCLSRGLVRSHLAWEHRRQNRGRPTVSTPATLTPVGYLQFENGGFYADNSPDFTTLFGINRVTKLTVASRLQLLALSGHLLKQVELPAMLSRGVALEKSSPDFGQSYCLERDINLP